MNAQLTTQLQDANTQLAAWYRNPYVVGALALSVGLVLGVHFSK